MASNAMSPRPTDRGPLADLVAEVEWLERAVALLTAVYAERRIDDEGGES